MILLAGTRRERSDRLFATSFWRVTTMVDNNGGAIQGQSRMRSVKRMKREQRNLRGESPYLYLEMPPPKRLPVTSMFPSDTG